MTKGVKHIERIEDLNEELDSISVGSPTYFNNLILQVRISKMTSIKHVDILTLNEMNLPLLNMYWLESLKIYFRKSEYFDVYGVDDRKILENRTEERMISLKNLVNLKKLDFEGEFNYNDLSYMKDLKILILPGVKIEKIYVLLENILTLKLKTLDIHISLNDDIAYYIGFIETLEYFNCPRGISFTEIGVKNLLRLKNLKKFDFTFGYKYIKEFTGLESIGIFNKKKYDSFDLSNLPNLTEALFFNCKLNDEDLKNIGSNTSIQHIDELNMTDKHLYYFYNLPLKEIVIAETKLSDEFFVKDNGSILYNSIEVVSLYKVEISNNTINEITLLPNLIELKINQCTVTNEIFNSIGKNCKKLKTLDVKSLTQGKLNYKLNGKSLMYLSKFEMPNLESLRLQSFTFTNADFEYFNYFKMPSLRKLTLSKLNKDVVQGLKILGKTKILMQIAELNFPDLGKSFMMKHDLDTVFDRKRFENLYYNFYDYEY